MYFVFMNYDPEYERLRADRSPHSTHNSYCKCDSIFLVLAAKRVLILTYGVCMWSLMTAEASEERMSWIRI